MQIIIIIILSHAQINHRHFANNSQRRLKIYYCNSQSRSNIDRISRLTPSQHQCYKQSIVKGNDSMLLNPWTDVALSHTMWYDLLLRQCSMSLSVSSWWIWLWLRPNFDTFDFNSYRTWLKILKQKDSRDMFIVFLKLLPKSHRNTDIMFVSKRQHTKRTVQEAYWNILRSIESIL